MLLVARQFGQERTRLLGQLPDRDKLYYDIIYTNGLEALRGDVTIDQALQAIETEANETFG